MKKPVASLILALTDRCNLECVYCYRCACDSGEDMSAEVLEKAISLVDHSGPALIQVTGGEPTLVPDMVELVGRLAGRMKRRPQLAIQTNGTLLNLELAEVLKEYGFQVGVSMDGPPDIQDSLRGKASETLRGLRLLEAMDMEFRVTTVVTEANVLRLDQLALLLGGFTNSRGIGLDMLVARGRAQRRVRLPSPQQLEEGLNSLVKAIAYINRHRSLPLQLREAEHCRGRRDTFCYAAVGRSLAVSPKGRLYPCGQTMGDSIFDLGSVDRSGDPGGSPLRDISLSSPDCRQCRLEGQCPGECPSRLHYNGRTGHMMACTLYRTLEQGRIHEWI